MMPLLARISVLLPVLVMLPDMPIWKYFLLGVSYAVYEKVGSFADKEEKS
jgi:hypothetical protein